MANIDKDPKRLSRRDFLKVGSLGLVELSLLLQACTGLTSIVPVIPGTPAGVHETLTPTPDKPFDPTAMFTATETPSPVSKLDPKIQELFKEQKVIYETGANGSIQVDLYDSPKKETIELSSFTRVDTQDGLNPNILTAIDKENNNYAYNPDHGWFQAPEVQTDPEKLDQYTEVNQDFFTDGRANITTALKYAENPTISPDAITPHYWVNYNSVPGVLGFGLLPTGSSGRAEKNYPEEYKNSQYSLENRPFAWTGFYKVSLKTGETIYIDSRTSKNPTKKNQDQLINLFYGFDEKTYIRLLKTLNASNQPILQEFMDSLNRDFETILAPPESLKDGTVISFDANETLTRDTNPIVGGLQKRGEIISLFNVADQDIFFASLSDPLIASGQSNGFSAPISELPEYLSDYILLTTFATY